MEPTLTQSGALYRAQHKVAERRRAFFRRWRKAGGTAPSQPATFGEIPHVHRHHRDNGR